MGARVDGQAWKLKVQELGKQWCRLSADEREAWHSKPSQEQAFRECAIHEPHESRAEMLAETYPGKDDRLDQNLTQKGKKLLSRHQTLASYRRFVTAGEWKRHDAGLCSAVGALDLDNIDVESTEEAINQVWGSFSRPHMELGKEWMVEMQSQQDSFRKLEAISEGSCHHSPCHCEYGICCASPWMPLVSKYVHSLSDHVNSRGLVCHIRTSCEWVWVSLSHFKFSVF